MRHRHSQRPTRTRRGFTLLEVLIVLAIIGVIAAMAVPQLLGQQKQAQIRTAEQLINNMEAALDIYAVANNAQYPQGGQEVWEMLRQPQEDGIQPYIEKLPKDPWGNVLQYEYPSSKMQNIDKPAIWSEGPPNGEEINNWEELFEQ